MTDIYGPDVFLYELFRLFRTLVENGGTMNFDNNGVHITCRGVRWASYKNPISGETLRSANEWIDGVRK